MAMAALPDKVQDTGGTLDLNSLIETSKIINASLKLEFILSHILRTAMGKFMVSKAAIITLSMGNDLVDVYRIAASRGLGNAPAQFTDLEAFGITYELGLLVPISSDKKLFGFIALGRKMNRIEYTEAEKNFLGTLASLAAIAIDNADRVEEMEKVNRSLDLTVQKLKTLFEQAKNYTPTLSREALLKMLFNAVAGQMMIRGMVSLAERGGEISEEVSRGGLTTANVPKQELERLFSLTLPERMTHETYPGLHDAGFLVAVPMRGSRHNVGVFLSGRKFSDSDFSESDLDFLFLAVSQAATTLEQSRLFAEALEKEAIERELQVAREIQAMLLPKNLPVIKGLSLSAINIPSLQVGGDYYDVIRITEEDIFIGIADVTGKGTPAALLMANLQASIKAYVKTVRTSRFNLPEMVAGINDIIYENTPADKFITFYGGVLHLPTMELTSVNAGHNPPYVISKTGKETALRTGGVILGVVPGLSYDVETITLTKGDVFFLYTDGITEAENANQDLFESSRLIAILKEKRHASAAEILNTVIAQVSEFQPPGKQIDDITAICVKVEP